MSEETTVSVQQLTKADFYLLEPRSPSKDLRAWLLVVTSFAIAIGFCLFAVLSYAFEEMQNLPPEFRTWLVIYGAWALALGGELSTPICVFEIYRKLGTEDHSRWDWVALVASSVATVAVLFLATASLLKVDVAWPSLVKSYGPILLMLAAGADGYAGFVETGLYLKNFDRRHCEWESKYGEWREWAAQMTGWAAGSMRQTDVLPPPADYIPRAEDERVVEKKPKRKKKVTRKTDRGFKVAPRGERDHYARQIENGWMAVCPECDWTRGGYDTRGKAIQAIIGHSKGCPGGISVEGKVGPGEWKDGRF